MYDMTRYNTYTFELSELKLHRDFATLYSNINWKQQIFFVNIFQSFEQNLHKLNLSQIFVLFVWFDSLCPSPQFFSHVGTSLPGLNQY